jgi:DNA-binding NarL/FixJ family response regulator
VNERTSIVLIDDHQTLLDLLTFAIDAEEDMEVVGTARTVAAGQGLIERTRPDVVLLECVLPDGDGLALVAGLIGHAPETQVVVLTGSQDTSLIARVAAAGVAGFLTKAGTLTSVIDTIRAARSGFMILDPAFLATLRSAEELVRRQPVGRGVPLVPALTDRELEVLKLLDQGKDPRTIARELSISVHTSRGYVKSLLVKLDCHSQLEAVITSRRMGILTGPGLLSAVG